LDRKFSTAVAVALPLSVTTSGAPPEPPVYVPITVPPTVTLPLLASTDVITSPAPPPDAIAIVSVPPANPVGAVTVGSVKTAAPEPVVTWMGVPLPPLIVIVGVGLGLGPGVGLGEFVSWNVAVTVPPGVAIDAVTV
jgi:hypothetical protein